MWDVATWRDQVAAQIFDMDDAAIERLFARIGYAVSYPTKGINAMPRKPKAAAAAPAPMVPPPPPLLNHTTQQPPVTIPAVPPPPVIPGMAPTPPLPPPLPSLSVNGVPPPAAEPRQRASRGVGARVFAICAEHRAAQPGAEVKAFKAGVIEQAVTEGLNRSSATVYVGKWLAEQK